MSKTAIIYWSGTGNTQAMAEAVAEGAKEVNSDAALFTVSEISAGDAASFDTLILGCPAMGDDRVRPLREKYCTFRIVRLGRRRMDEKLGGACHVGRGKPCRRRRPHHQRRAG